MIISRRIIGRGALGGIALAAMPGLAAAGGPATQTAVGGVRLGVCVGSYKDIPRPADPHAYAVALAQACAASGAGLVEFHSSQLEPDTRLYARARAGEPPLPALEPAELERLREERRVWRVTTPASHFTDARQAFEAAGATPFAYSFNFTNDMTDAEIESVFTATRALGAALISTNAAKVEIAPRLAPFADRHGVDLGFHNHANAEDHNEVASLESFDALFAVSPRCKANLDIGHFVAANQDPIAFIDRHHDKITHLHFKDRSPDKGRNMPWGMGETPLAEVLRQVQANGYDIPCLVEYEYYGYPGTGGSIEENRNCLAFMRAVLTGTPDPTRG